MVIFLFAFMGFAGLASNLWGTLGALMLSTGIYTYSLTERAANETPE
jgi:hypothetical protein